MIQGMYTSAYGMIPRINQQNAIADNLANVSTSGHKKSSIFLRQLITSRNALDHALGNERSEVPEDIRVDYSQGTFNQTARPLDLAINGQGFFRVRDAEGQVFYTRDGRFMTDTAGMLMNREGMYVLDDRSRTIQVQGNEVMIHGNGTVAVDGEVVGAIGLVDFATTDYQNLREVGSGMFEKPADIDEAAPGADTSMLQGYVEDSNTDPVREMVDMIEVFRMFELGQKAIQTQDETLQRLVSEVGVVRG